ncbi:BREX-1 system adenine-specific DNA-methyltransferase PglX, partial [Candidatus Bathyarchaeota archaeon]|nr:BREX-1 system adenine-specific DNA-methyltransferase PglX [Candidatus Bathyarchaeota archaeon]
LKEDTIDSQYVEQAIKYSYNKGVTWAILTNFKELTVFNAEWVPDKRNMFSNQFIALKAEQFLEDDSLELLWLLSKESMIKGELDNRAEKLGKKIKKEPIDAQLLSDFTKWREILSKNIMTFNKDKRITEGELDETVQRILDRLIFIRKCEDNELEENIMKTALREWEDRRDKGLYERLQAIFKYFDQHYDSELFGEHLCDSIVVTSDVLKEIVSGLYETKEKLVSYDFSAIDADVLGSVYEQYLGHILKKSASRAKITESHVHRKEQGIYYTPTYIVKYIVENTLGELLRSGKVPIDRIRVLDPACGSGSFLIKAFDVLNDYYVKHHEDYGQNKLDSIGSYTTKLEILKNNIFGVDLDAKAVEISQLNMLLKVAEKGQRLPLLRQNIKCGNSLVDDYSVVGDKAFKWKEQFREVMNEGGFDVVIGNPPYVRQEELSEIKPYLETNYETYQGTADLFVYFLEKELKILKEGGYLGMIVSNKWLRAGYGENLRRFLTGFWIEEFIDFGDLRVFVDATIYPCIIIMRKTKKPNPKIRICKMATLKFDSLGEYIKSNSHFINQSELSEAEWNIQRGEANELLSKLRTTGLPLEEYVGTKIYRGILTGLNEAFIIDEKKRKELTRDDSRCEEIIKPFLTGSESKRYSIRSKKKYIIFTRRGIDISQYPSILRYLTQFKNELSPKKSKEGGIGRKPGSYEWYEIQDVTGYYKEFEKPKIIWGNLAKRSSFSLDDRDGFYVNAPACILPTNSKYVLGILNSKLMSYFLRSICAERQGGFIEQKPVYVSQVPIKKPTEMQEIEMTRLVEQMLLLDGKLINIGDKLTGERARIEDEIRGTDAEIDTLVYEIYGISEEEKGLIEECLR